MKFTLSALKKYLRTEASAAEIRDGLTLLGLEIEEMEDKAAPLAPFIVGEIVSCEMHPDSDHLHLLKVSTGTAELQIVCGAPNVRVGLKGVLSRPGDIIPSTGERLKAGKIRGVESQGMMCSIRELGLGDEHDGILELAPSAKAGEAVAKYLPADVIYDAEVTSNRPDYLGVIGIARDLAAGGYGEFIPLDVKPVAGAFVSPIKVRNEALDVAKEFNIRHIRGVANGASPEWLAAYLAAIGNRSISALVDITNYALNEWCRPLHVFDADKIKGSLVVAHAKGGEKFLALDGNEYTLAAGDVVIRDDVGVQSLAGVMGGAASACGLDTRNILLESAYFEPVAIRATARRLGLSSESKYRFERGIDPSSTDWGMEAASALVLSVAGGEASEVIRTGANPYKPYVVEFPVAHFAQRIGLDMPVPEMASILKRLGCEVKEKGAALLITPPSWRADIAIKEDITEELIRVYGYDKLPAVSVVAEGAPAPVLAASQSRLARARRELAMRGLVEAYTWSFTNSLKQFGGAGVRVANPITSELDEMRTSILPNLLDAVAANNARGVRSVSLFEIGPVFHGANPGEQKTYASAVRFGPVAEGAWEVGAREFSIYDMKADMAAVLALYGLSFERLKLAREGVPEWANPHASARVLLGPVQVGIFGEVHPIAAKKFDLRGKAVFFELDLGALPVKEAKGTAKKPAQISEFPASTREFSMLFGPTVGAGEVKASIVALKNPLVRGVSIFDVYTGAELGERRAIGVRLVIGSTEKTLDDAEIAAVFNAAVAAGVKLGGELRS